MAAELPTVPRPQFDSQLATQLGRAGCGTDPARLSEALWRYYETLRQWSPRLALIGEGTAESVIERHFGESLAGVDLLPASGVVVDVGSGAGFPGLVLAAARPNVSVVLVEARRRKVSFLRSAARAMGVQVQVCCDRIAIPLPQSLPDTIDCLTARAIRFDAAIWAAMAERIADDGRVLLWAGREAPSIQGFVVAGEVPLEESQQRRILNYQNQRAPNA